MSLTFKYMITNLTEKRAGPFNVSDIFGPHSSTGAEIYVEAGECVEFCATMENPQDTIARRFSNRLSDLGLPEHLVTFSTTGIPVAAEIASPTLAPAASEEMIAPATPNAPEPEVQEPALPASVLPSS